jgi:hypothetical protein
VGRWICRSGGKAFRMENPSFTVRVMILVSVGLVFPIIMIISGTEWYITLFSSIFAVGNFCYFTHFCLIRKIVVGKCGIEYRTRIKCMTIRWSDIKVIGVSDYPFRGKGMPIVIYIKNKSDQSSEYDVSSSLIRIYYRESIIAEIQKYWSAEILGLSLVQTRD